ncbi:MAG: recombinase family protein [Streptomyces sp.]|nr:recombinase family protein [Streptomyces sp.]
MTDKRPSIRYLRRSKAKSGAEQSKDTRSIEDQRARAERLEREAGYELLREFTDDGVSGFKDVDRPGFDDLCELIDSGEVDGAVVVSDAEDRLGRRGSRAALAFRELCAEHGVDVHTAESGLDRTSEDEGEIGTFFRAWQARRESAVKSRRLTNASTERALRGEAPRAGVVPFGWNSDRRTLNPDEARLLQEAAEAVLRGASKRAVAKRWNELGIKTSRGGQWTRAGVQAALTRPRNAGLVRLRRDVVPDVVGDWEPLWDVETHEALVALLGNRALTRQTGKGSRRGEAAKSLLTGIALCECGGTLRYQNHTKQRPVYRCDSKEQRPGPHVSIAAEDADARARAVLYRVLLFGDRMALGAERPEVLALAGLRKRRAAITEEVARLVAAVRSGALSADDVAAARAELAAEDARLAREEGEVRARSAQTALLATLRDGLWSGPPPAPGSNALGAAADEVKHAFGEMPLLDQRALVAGLVEVRVGPGRSADRVRVTPKIGVDESVTAERLAEVTA